MPAFLRRQTDSSPDDFAHNLKNHFGRLLIQPLKSVPRTIEELVDFGLDDEIMGVLFALVDRGYSEQEVVIVFLYLFSQAEVGKSLLPRIVIRAIRKAFKKRGISDDLCEVTTAEITPLNDSQKWLPKSMIEDSHLMP